MADRIYLSSPHMSEDGREMRYVKEAFDSNWIAPLGPQVDGFEREVAARVGAKAAAALSSGTAAIHLALKAAGVGRGDTVLCSTLTFSAAANPVIYQDAVPVFVGSDAATWNMCPRALERAFRAHPAARAVIVVHIYGLAADMDAILEVCRKHRAAVIEDAAEALGTLYKGRHVGTFGDCGALSFNGNKIITTSGGGMLVSDDEELAARARFWATQSRDPAPHYQHSELGYNYRMSNVLAAIGRGQLEVLDERLAQKRRIFQFYREELGGLEGLEFMPVNEWNAPNHWLSCVTLGGRVRPAEVIDALERENIEARPLWKPMHLQPFFSGCEYFGSDTAERLFEDGVCLPSDTKMTPRDLDRVAGIIRGLWRGS